MLFLPWLRVKFITAPGIRLQLVWGESWSKPHFKTANLLNRTHGNSPSATAQETLFGGSVGTFRRGSHTIQMSKDILWSSTRTAKHSPQPWRPWNPIQGDSPCWLPVYLPAWTSASPGHWLRRSPGSHQPRGTWGCWQAPWHSLGEDNIYICKTAAALASRISCVGMKLHGRYHNFLKVQGNSVKLKRPSRRNLVGAGWDIEAIPAQAGQGPSKSRRTLSQCPTLVHTNKSLYLLVFQSLILSLCTAWTCFCCCFHFPRKSGGGGRGGDLCEIRKQTEHSDICKCQNFCQRQCHLAIIFMAETAGFLGGKGKSAGEMSLMAHRLLAWSPPHWVSTHLTMLWNRF